MRDFEIGRNVRSMQAERQGKICGRCDSLLPGGKSKCSVCGAWVLVERKPSGKRVTPGLENDGSILLSNVTSASADRVNTSIFGEIWGTSKFDNGTCLHGMVRTSVTLLGGARGAGKSTLVTQGLSELSAKLERETMYISCEEALAEIRLRAERLNIPNMQQIRMVEALNGASNVAQLIEKRQPCAVVLDSLRGLVGNDQGAALEACKLCKILAVENHCPIVIIQHVTKGEDIAGSNDDQHEVDTVMTFFPTIGDVRLLEVQKNRFGRAFIGQQFLMTETGLRLYGDLTLPDLDNPEGCKENEEEE